MLEVRLGPQPSWEIQIWCKSTQAYFFFLCKKFPPWAKGSIAYLTVHGRSLEKNLGPHSLLWAGEDGTQEDEENSEELARSSMDCAFLSLWPRDGLITSPWPYLCHQKQPVLSLHLHRETVSNLSWVQTCFLSKPCLARKLTLESFVYFVNRSTYLSKQAQCNIKLLLRP